MNSDEPLTPQQWQYISVLIAGDIRGDRANGIDDSADMHLEIWEKIQPLCRWDDVWEDDEE